jgi:hypothetical protein
MVRSWYRCSWCPGFAFVLSVDVPELILGGGFWRIMHEDGMSTQGKAWQSLADTVGYAPIPCGLTDEMFLTAPGHRCVGAKGWVTPFKIPCK